MNYDQAFARLMEREGGYTDNASDPGGKTRYGITESVARSNGYFDSMNELPIALAKVIYFKSYWAACRCEDLPDTVQYHVFDGAVNSGVSQSIKWLQRAICVTDDGVIGKITLDASQNLPGGILAARYNGQRLLFMTKLKIWDAFSQGWATRIAKNLIEA